MPKDSYDLPGRHFRGVKERMHYSRSAEYKDEKEEEDGKGQEVVTEEEEKDNRDEKDKKGNEGHLQQTQTGAGGGIRYSEGQERTRGSKGRRRERARRGGN